MKRSILAVVAATVLAASAVAAGLSSSDSAQVNVATSGGTITYLVGGNTVVIYIGNGKPPVWQGTQEEFRAAMRRGAGLAEAFTP